MKKRLISLILTVMILVTPALAATYACVSVSYPIMVNGEELAFTDAQPMNYEGRTMLPLRAVAEALDISIEWANNRVEITTIDLEALKESCVMVKVDVGNDGYYDAQGSGVYIDYDEILTCFHVVNGYEYYEVEYQSGGDPVAVKLADTAESEDAAILTPPEFDVKPVKIGDSDEIEIGDMVYIISCPKGEMNVVTSGRILRYVKSDGIYFYSVSAEVHGGSSGGAVFNSKGELIGIVQAALGKIMRFIPINDIRRELAK